MEKIKVLLFVFSHPLKLLLKVSSKITSHEKSKHILQIILVPNS